MQKTVDLFKDSLIGIRGGTVNTGLIDSIKVNAYNSQFSLNQVAHSGRQDNLIWVEPFDLSINGAILSAIQNSGFSAYQFSKTRIIISIPPISGDEKKKIIKHISKLAEDARISIRNIRKNWRNSLSKEELDRQDKKIQEVTNRYTSNIDQEINRKIEVIR